MKKLCACSFALIMLCSGCGTTVSENSEKQAETVAVTEIELETTVPNTESETEKISETNSQIMLHGYDEDKNIKFDFAGLNFSIPSYYKKTNEEENQITYYAYDNGTVVCALNITYTGDEEAFHDLEENKAKLHDYFVSQAGIGSKKGEKSDITIDGMEGQLFSYTQVNENLVECVCFHVFLFDSSNHTAISILLLQNSTSRYNFTDDYAQMLKNITRVEDNTPVEETNLIEEEETTSTPETELSTDDVFEMPDEIMVTTSETVEPTESLEEPETETELQTEVSNESIYDIAIVKKNDGYDVYFLFDEDTKHFWYFLSYEDGILEEGTYTGDLDSGMYLSYDNEDLTGNEFMKRKERSSTVVLTDFNGYDWEFKQIAVSEAEDVLNKLK